MFCPNTLNLKIPWNLYINTDQRTKKWCLDTNGLYVQVLLVHDSMKNTIQGRQKRWSLDTYGLYVHVHSVHVSIKNIFQGEKKSWSLETGYCLFFVVLDMSNNLWVWLLLLMSARDASSVVLVCIPRKTKGSLRASLGLLTVVYGVAWCGTQPLWRISHGSCKAPWTMPDLIV